MHLPGHLDRPEPPWWARIGWAGGVQQPRGINPGRDGHGLEQQPVLGDLQQLAATRTSTSVPASRRPTDLPAAGDCPASMWRFLDERRLLVLGGQGCASGPFDNLVVRIGLETRRVLSTVPLGRPGEPFSLDVDRSGRHVILALAGKPDDHWSSSGSRRDTSRTTGQLTTPLSGALVAARVSVSGRGDGGQHRWFLHPR